MNKQLKLFVPNKLVSFPAQPGAKIEPWVGKIHCGDSVEIMKQIPDGTVDICVTSPPYNIRNSSGGGWSSSAGKWPNAALVNGYQGYDDNLPHDVYVKWQRANLTEMMRVLKDDGAIFYNHKWRVQNGLLQDRNDILEGFPVRQIIIWSRKGGINFNSGYFLPTYEVIYLIAKPKFKLAKGANSMGDIWEIPQTSGLEHPAPFPVELAKRCVKSVNGKVVLDPFIGSGSTAIAASMLGKQWIGIDISLEYCEMARSRIEDHHFKAEIQTQ